MIVDTHVHLTVPGFTKGKFLLSNARIAAHLYNRVHGTNITPDQYINGLKEKVDPDCTKLLKSMDEAGIEKSIIFGVDWAYARTGEPRVNNREQNRFHADMARKYPDRFTALAALDPRRPDALDQATEAIEEWGMKGFKLHPSAGFYPNDPICFPLYEKCTEWGIPIVFHSGGGEGNWVCGQPMYIATAAENFHDVKMIMAHAGMESWQQASQAASLLPNVFLDISVRGQWEFCMNPSRFYEWLRNLINETTPWKVLFASDAPLPTSWISNDKWVKAIKDPETDISFTREEIDIVLGKAAASVFGL